MQKMLLKIDRAGSLSPACESSLVSPSTDYGTKMEKKKFKKKKFNLISCKTEHFMSVYPILCGPSSSCRDAMRVSVEVILLRNEYNRLPNPTPQLDQYQGKMHPSRKSWPRASAAKKACFYPDLTTNGRCCFDRTVSWGSPSCAQHGPCC
jgi:hypothetical protein